MNFIKKFHFNMMDNNTSYENINTIANKTIFDDTLDTPLYKSCYQFCYKLVQNLYECLNSNIHQRKMDYEYVQSVLKLHDVSAIEYKLKSKRHNIFDYLELLKTVPILKEVEEKTHEMFKLDDNNDISSALIKYISGNCWLNARLSLNHPLTETDKYIETHINRGVSLVKPLSSSISLFHGFEKYTNYIFFDDKINVKGFTSKTLSLNVAKRFAYSCDYLRPQFLIVHYANNSQQLKYSIRPYDEEFEFITHSDETFKVIRICKYFEGIRFLTFYVCTPI